jgi:hypothetical protein
VLLFWLEKCKFSNVLGAWNHFGANFKQRCEAHFVLSKTAVSQPDDGRLAERSAAMSIEEGGSGTETVEQKVDKLSASVDHRFDAVDRQFDDVRAALAEQRQYTEFAFDRLASEMRAGFKGVESRFDGLDSRFGGLESRFGGLESRFDGLEGRFSRLERKLDQFIDTQFKSQ